MIKAVLVDDERPALRELEFLLKKHPDISVIEMFTSPLAAIEKMEELKPQVVFLDINMPQLRGIDAASRILDLSPETDIVFVTAFDQYAVEAFELHALDYLLKPIDPGRLQKTVERVLKKQPVVRETRNRRLQIKCLGGFKLAWENREPIKWRTEKTKELFAFLLHNQGREIPKEELLDQLWPDDDPERAIRQLYNGIYYIRKALEEYGVKRNLISIGSNYSLRLGPVNWDVLPFYAFEKRNKIESLETLEELEALYAGDYLEGAYFPWADIERERIAKLYLQCLIKLAQKMMEEKRWDRAENYLIKAYNKDPYEENITELLLELYLITGKKSQMVRHFNRYADFLKKELGIKPNEKLYAIYQAMK